MSNLTLQQKKAHFARIRQSNYAASLRLEGFKVTQPDAESQQPACDAGVIPSRQA